MQGLKSKSTSLWAKQLLQDGFCVPIPTKPPSDSEIYSPIDSDILSPTVRSLAG
jgi:hypothetical protein